MTETARIEKNIEQLFSFVNDLRSDVSEMKTILPRIEKKLDCLPCIDHTTQIASLKQEVFLNEKESLVRIHAQELYAIKHIWVSLLGVLGLISVILSIAAMMGIKLGG